LPPVTGRAIHGRFSDAQWQVEYHEKSTAVEQVTRRIQQGFARFF